MPLVSELLNGLPTVMGLSDVDCMTACVHCGRSQNLSQASVATDDVDTTYSCVAGCGPILVVSPLPDPYRDDQGHGVSEWLIRNPEHLFVRIMGAPKPLRFAARPDALS